MFRFFRQIRQRLLAENSPAGRYLLYAIGEIVLVVVGILIALQVNEWNEIRKEKDQEQVLLAKLAQNLNDDIGLLTEIIRSDSMMFARLSLMSKELLAAHEISEVDIRDNSLFIANQFYPNRTTMDNIISSGKIDIMRNDELMDQLMLYYRSVQIYGEGIDQSLKNYSRDIEHFIMGFDHRREHPRLPKKSIQDYLEDPFFLNALHFKNGLLKFQIRNYTSLVAQAEDILSLIESDIAP